MWVTDRSAAGNGGVIGCSGAASLSCSLLALCLVAVQVHGGAESKGEGDPTSDDLFAGPPVREISIRISSEAMSHLRTDHRSYVEATVSEGGKSYAPAGLRLKGASGSFRGLDDKPSLTLTFDRFLDGGRFHGTRRIHLNNSVEDPGYLNEMIGSELFRAAGVPATRVTHARVELNGRPLGLYVLKEGFTEDLARRYFTRVDGKWSDDDPELVTDRSGEGSSAPEKSGDGKPTWHDLEVQFDMDRFISFMAMEIMVCHRDGYSLARNNFRTYRDPETSRKVFLPHGMDQLFGRSDLPWKPNLFGNVARAVMETPQGRDRYQARFKALYAEFFDPARLTNRVNEMVAGLGPFLSERERIAIDAEVLAIRERITKRAESLKHQLEEADPLPVQFVGGAARLERWASVDVPPDGRLDQACAPDGIPSLAIQAGAATSASWRTMVRLERGRYRFEGSVRVDDYAALPYGRNHGATLRVAGDSRRSSAVIVSAGWKGLEVGFEVSREEEQVELICEYRASGGRAWFDRGALRLVRIE